MRESESPAVDLLAAVEVIESHLKKQNTNLLAGHYYVQLGGRSKVCFSHAKNRRLADALIKTAKELT